MKRKTQIGVIVLGAGVNWNEELKSLHQRGLQTIPRCGTIEIWTQEKMK